MSDKLHAARQTGEGSGEAPEPRRLPPDAKVRTSHRGVVLAGIMAFVMLFAGMGSWLALAKLRGAVIASGSVVVRGKPKSIQHLDGGIVKAIHVETGDAVERGQLLLELDDTVLRANLAIYRNRLVEFLARKARLEAERDGAPLRTTPPDLVKILRLEGYEDKIRGQARIMKAGAETREGMKAQLRKKVEQLEEQIRGLEGLRTARRKQLKIIGRELATMNTLRRRGLTTSNRVLALERQHSGLIGDLANMEAELARLREAVVETRLAIMQIDRENREKIVKELHVVEAKIQDLTQQVLATEKKLARTKVRAPVSGIVHELRVHTIGGVIRPGEVIMQIVPSHEKLEFEVNVPAHFIDRVHLNQEVRLRFPSFDQKTTPEIMGVVSVISPSSIVIPETGQSFYRVEVKVAQQELTRLGNKKLVPGMPVEAFIQTGERTALSYLLKPLMDNFAHAFRED